MITLGIIRVIILEVMMNLEEKGLFVDAEIWEDFLKDMGFSQTMKYKYNFRGETSWDTAYQMEGTTCTKKGKSGHFFVGKGWYHSHLYSFQRCLLGLLCILKQKGGKVGWIMEGPLSIRLKSPKDWGRKKLRKWVGGCLF